MPREFDERLCGVIGSNFVPVRTDIGRQLPEKVKLRCRATVAPSPEMICKTCSSALIRAAIRDARRTMVSVPGAAVTPTRMRSLVSQRTFDGGFKVRQELLFGFIGHKAQRQL